MKAIEVAYNIEGIEGLCVIRPQLHQDSRGYFLETYNIRDFLEAGFDYHFVQDNQSKSKKGVLRGLHYQIEHPQTKLVRVIKGTVFDVVVDLRKNSSTFGKWHGEILTEDNKKQFLIPKGFAHGFLVLSDEAEFCYKCDDYYQADDQGGIAWNDPEIGIVWPEVTGTYTGSASPEGYKLEGSDLILSEKDQKWPGLSESHTF